jgi:hypothetical protein
MKDKHALYLVSEEHPCPVDGCDNIVPYADEPYCYMHSEDDGYVEQHARS